MIAPISNGGMMAQMELMKAEASNAPSNNSTTNQFGQLFLNAVNQTNNIQKEAHEISRSFVAGESGVSAADVMRLNSESEISMAITTQVRNKLLEQYKEILNTQL